MSADAYLTQADVDRLQDSQVRWTVQACPLVLAALLMSAIAFDRLALFVWGTVIAVPVVTALLYRRVARLAMQLGPAGEERDHSRR